MSSFDPEIKYTQKITKNERVKAIVFWFVSLKITKNERVKAIVFLVRFLKNFLKYCIVRQRQALTEQIFKKNQNDPRYISKIHKRLFV